MNSVSTHLPSAYSDYLGPAVPETWRPRLDASLAADEKVLASLSLDLDTQLQFRSGIVALTDRRLMAWDDAAGAWQSWPFRDGMQLRHRDHGGVAALDLVDPAGKLAGWRFTLAQDPAARNLSDRFKAQLECVLAGRQPTPPEPLTCPTCDAPLPPGTDECPTCAREIHTPPSTWTLFRLWRFAQPYKGQLLAGFVLTLLSTAATLVPPYLTMPLMDEVLIPFQNGAPIDGPRVMMMLGGLLIAAIFAWGLGWAKTYILALVSERIGADLRTTTYEHLQGLSLEYFGGKRTGDLMARIGAETDRICLFLSMNLLDFATDVLMITMTAIILVSINPWLALVTLVPLPFIAWLIHTVRDKLRYGFEQVDRSHHIGGIGFYRRVIRQAHQGLGRHVDDDLGFCCLHGAHQCGQVAHIAVYGLHACAHAGHVKQAGVGGGV